VFPIDTDVLVLGVLLLLATVSSKVSARAGVPLIIVFIVIGMLAGSEGPGRVDFNDYDLAHAIGTVALVLILFDGGLQTSLRSLRRAAAPAGILATFGVIITAVVVGLASSWLLDLPLEYGLLLGSIVGSTDAAAMFTALRSSGLQVRPRLASTLEVESGSNDPMAVLLTVGCLEFIRGTIAAPTMLAWFLVEQIGLGLLIGWAAGRAAAALINRIRLSAAGLYPMLTFGAALASFGAAAAVGGSGFLAVYVTGIVVGNRRVVFHRGLALFHNGLAWLAQIVMFVVLGLLSTPTHVREAWPEGLLLAGVLVLVARPLAVVLCLAPFRYPPREVAFAAWAGLRGAVPIILGIYPLMFGIDLAKEIFDLVFFVVLVSVLAQGWSLGLVARWFGVTTPTPPDPPVTVEVTSLREVDADIVSYQVQPRARAAGRRIADLGLTGEMVVAMIVRDRDLVLPKGSTRILAGDHVFVTLRPKARWLLDHVFSPEDSPLLPEPLDGRATLNELHREYGLTLPGSERTTLGQLVRDELGRAAQPGDEVRLGMLRFTVLTVEPDGRPRDVRLDLGPPPQMGSVRPVSGC
jgi:potassium/hydrogen antiporter